MPTCPGCERSVPYDRLATHERHCWAIHGHNRATQDSLERLERRIDTVERRLRKRIRELEAELDVTTAPKQESPTITK